jgi:glycosyltransferase involved in cell wall biosynthesis
MKHRKPFHPLAVRQVHLDRHVQDLTGLERYNECLVVFRRDSAVIARRTFPVRNGMISRSTLLDFIPETAWVVHEQLAEQQQPPPARPPSVTLIVCTHDRPDMLAGCIASLLGVEWEPLEIIVVDSAPSNDATRTLVAGFPHIRYVLSPRRGLDIARNAGIAAASGSIIAFTDDDARVDPLWIRGLVAEFEDPMVAVATGVTLPYELETEGQLLFEKMGGFTRGYRRTAFAPRLALWAGAAGAGVNMALRASMIRSIGLFDEALDAGTRTRSGGDHDYFSRALARGYRVLYTPRALVWHCHRGEHQAVQETMFGYGVGVYAWWTRALIREREYGVLLVAPLWFLRYHFHGFLRSLLGLRSTIPLSCAAAEMLGALWGPVAYFQARYIARLTEK